jgi:uncharacterized damage-inducible protein DinB
MEITRIEPFLEYLESFRGRTRRVIAAIPPDKLEWRPKDGVFSCGDLARHIAAIGRYMFAENAAGRPSAYPGHGEELAKGHTAVIEFFEKLHAESVEIFRTLSPQDLALTCVTPAGTPIRVWKWLRSMIEHEAHHRGQIYQLLNLIGAPTPPLYGLTSEEVLERSIAT